MLAYCPYCKKEIENTEVKCPHCWVDLTFDFSPEIPPLKFFMFRVVLMTLVIYLGWVYNVAFLWTTSHFSPSTIGDLILMVIYGPLIMITFLFARTLFFFLDGVPFLIAFAVVGLVFSYFIAKWLYEINNSEFLTVWMKK